MMKADLHIHSTISDGSDTIEQILRIAEEKGLDAIAITDHDTLSHLAVIDRLKSASRVKVLGGIELSAADPENNTRAHILGYRLRDPGPVADFARPLLEARNKNTEQQAKILRSHGYKLPAEKLPRADGKYLYKQHIMSCLVSTGQAGEMFGSFYQTIFKNNGICAFDIGYLNVFEAVRTIKRAGGLAVLAHSGQQQNFYLIPKLVECGLDGLELNHPANHAGDMEIIQGYAREYGLFLTGGSDCHGAYEPEGCGIGGYLSEESGVNAICLE